MLLPLAAALFCGAVALLANVATSLRNGYFDARSRGAPTPDLLYADQDPFWFYGLTALAAAIGIYAAILAWDMMKEVLRKR